MRSLLKTLSLAALSSLLLSGAALAEDPVTLRYLASHGGVSAHELADALGYYEPYGIKLENEGYAAGGRNRSSPSPRAASISARPRRRR